MFTFETCDGYKAIHTDNDPSADAPAICVRLEAERGDGFAVVACRNGEIVADAEGWRGRSGRGTDAATATSMYDGW